MSIIEDKTLLITRVMDRWFVPLADEQRQLRRL